MVKGLPTEWGECLCTVVLNVTPWTVACWKGIIAVGYSSGTIVLDAITGSQEAVLPLYTSYVKSITFSSDGTSLVSGGEDMAIRLWDVQTGGVIKTFYGHTKDVLSVSISADCTMIASGSEDRTIRLWNIQMEECLYVMEQQERVYFVGFSPMNSQCLLSASGGKVLQWDVISYKIIPVYDGSHVTFSLDQVQLVLCQGVVVIVQHFDKRQLSDCCCLIPGGRLIAVATGSTINVWDITSSDPCLIKTYVGHDNVISSLIFYSPSSLISSSYDQSVKFWQIGDLLADQVVTNQKSTPGASASIMSITLQTTDGITISSDSKGVVRVWEISTGYCKESFQTLAKDPKCSDLQLINNRLIFVWYLRKKIYLQDMESGELHVVDIAEGGIKGIGDYEDDEDEDYHVKISGDGSRVFHLQWKHIQAWDMLTGEVVGKVEDGYYGWTKFLNVDGSRVWAHSQIMGTQGWDFGISGSPPVQISKVPPPSLNSTKQWDIGRFMITDIVTGKVVFQLAGRFGNPVHSQWDGQYLVAGYKSGEVLILDFNHVIF